MTSFDGIGAGGRRCRTFHQCRALVCVYSIVFIPLERLKMVYCAAFGCTNSSQKGRGMFIFPKDKRLREVWTKKVNRENWTPSAYSRLCDEHFEEECFEIKPSVAQSIGYTRKGLRLRKGSIPTIFSTKNNQKSTHPPLRKAYEKRRRLEVNMTRISEYMHTYGRY